MNADAAIVTSLLVVGAVSVAKEAQAGHVDAVRIGVGLTGAGIGLAVLAQFSEQLATAFSVVLVFGALLKAGPDFINKTSANLFGTSYANPDTPTGGGPKHL